MVAFSVTLVRHGETTANKDGVIQGHQDVALSEVGVQQARLVAVRLQNDKFTHIFASDLSRAAQTAQAIVEANTVCQCSVQFDQRLRERKFGHFEGKTFKDLFAAAQKSNKKWPDFTPEGAETYAEVRFRAQAFFQELCEKMGSAGLALDRSYISTSLKDRHAVDGGLSNGRTQVSDARTADKLLLTADGRADLGAASIHCADGQADDKSTQPGEEGVAAKRPRIQEPQLHRLSLEGTGLLSDIDSDCVLGELQGAVATTMARSNSSSSSGCSSLHDSVECPEADIDFPTPTEDEERDTDSSDMGISRSQKDPAPNSNVPDDSHQVSEGVQTQHWPRERTSSVGTCQPPNGWYVDVEGLQPWVRDTDPSPVFGSSVAPGSVQGCPNVSLSPLLEHRLTSVSSVSSGRNSSFDDADVVPSAVGEVLIVSHGGLIKELVTHFIEDLNCKVPGGKGHALRVCPNTGVSRFMVTLSDLDLKPTVTCLLIHDKDHLRSLQDPLQKQKQLPAV